MKRIIKLAVLGLIANIAFSLYNVGMGIFTHSWWLLTLGIYYFILSLVRFLVIRSRKDRKQVARTTGIMLMLMSLPLVGTVVLSYIEDRGTRFNMVIMLAIATYTFAKVTLATVNIIKSRKSNYVKVITLRNISFADACVSLFSLQRSMLLTFEGIGEGSVRLMNLLLGTAVCVLVFLLGLNLARPKAIIFKTLNNK